MLHVKILIPLKTSENFSTTQKFVEVCVDVLYHKG